MEYNIKAIETKLFGYTFRSRLEARWAAFFQLCGWRWDYEPVDFEGWMPDFALYGANQITYVEVKPFVACDRSVARKIDNSSCDDEVLILGQTCPLPDENRSHASRGPHILGWMREKQYCDCGLDENGDPCDCEALWEWENAYFCWNTKDQIGFFRQDGREVDRISGSESIDICKSTNHLWDRVELQGMWGDAHKKTRWVKE